MEVVPNVSIGRMSELDFDVLCPGHGNPVVGGASEQVRALMRSASSEWWHFLPG